MAEDLLRQAVVAAKSGKRSEATQLIKQYIRQNPKDVRGWLALARLSDDDAIQKESLKRVLRLEPTNAKAREMMSQIEAQQAQHNPFLGFEEPPPLTIFDESYDDAAEPTYNLFAEEVSPTFDDLKPSPAISQRVPIKAKSSGRLELYIGIGMLLLALAAIPLIGYYAYQYRHLGLFGLFGPDLDQKIQTSTFSLRYPNQWQARSIENNSAVVIASANLESWEQISTQNIDFSSQDVFLGQSELFNELGTALDQDTVVIIMTPVTPEVLNQVNISNSTNYSSFQQYVDAEFDRGNSELSDLEELSEAGIKIEFDSDRKELEVDGNPAIFVFQEMGLEIDDDVPYAEFFQLLETEYGVYMATIQHGNQEYLFMLISIGEKAASHQRTARRMLRTIEFLN